MASLDAADEVFITSSTRDVQGVHRIDARELVGTPGPVTRHTSEVFAARAGRDVDP
jgi:branched-chain amino acid aminotransferase